MRSPGVRLGALALIPLGLACGDTTEADRTPPTTGEAASTPLEEELEAVDLEAAERAAAQEVDAENADETLRELEDLLEDEG